MLARLAVAVAALLTIAMVALVVLPASAFAAVATEQNIAGLPVESRRALPVELAPAPDKKLYVALGDSFSSGEGAPAHVYVKGGLLGFVPQRYKVFLGDPGSEGYACHRSPHAYPVTVATGSDRAGASTCGPAPVPPSRILSAGRTVSRRRMTPFPFTGSRPT